MSDAQNKIDTPLFDTDEVASIWLDESEDWLC